MKIVGPEKLTSFYSSSTHCCSGIKSMVAIIRSFLNLRNEMCYLCFGQSEKYEEETKEVAAGYDVHVAVDTQWRGEDDGHHKVCHRV